MKFIKHFQRLKQHANPKLEIAGILITMDQERTNLSAQVTGDLERTLGGHVNIFKTHIPRSVKVGEACGKQMTICEYWPDNPAAIAYQEFVKELIGNAG
jgi:chromosome partitioning protein